MKKLLSCPFIVLIGVALISALSLAAALTAELGFGLKPCILCLYQRFPFLLALIFSLFGIALCVLGKEKGKSLLPWLLGANALLFLLNSAVAFYHSGVEQKWWVSALEGCAVPAFGGGPENLLENILSAPTGRCDVIPWADPIIGLSMANYNVILCFGLFVACTASLVRLLKARNSCGN